MRKVNYKRKLNRITLRKYRLTLQELALKRKIKKLKELLNK